MQTFRPNTRFVQQWNPVIDDWTNWDCLRDPIAWDDTHLVRVCPQGDLFGPQVSDDSIDQVFSIMLACQLIDRPAPRFELLTRHADRLHQYLTATNSADLVLRLAIAGTPIIMDAGINLIALGEAATTLPLGLDGSPDLTATPHPFGYLQGIWPLPCLSLGVHLEDQRSTDAMLPFLTQTPAASRWAQLDELRGPVTLTAPHLVDVLGGEYPFPNLSPQYRTSRLEMLDRVVVAEQACGNPEADHWLQSLVKQCAKAKVVLELVNRPLPTTTLHHNFFRSSVLA